MIQKATCILCGLSNVEMQNEIPKGTKLYRCSRCGNFEISSSIVHRMDLCEYSEARYILSGLSRRAWVQEEKRMERENTHSWKPYLINETTIQDQLDSLTVSRSPLDRVDRLLLLVRERTIDFRQGASLNYEIDYPLIFARNADESLYLSGLAMRMGYLESSEGDKVIRKSSGLCLTPPGWERVEVLLDSTVQSNKVFVAMWFDKNMTPIWDGGFKPELLALGYDPIRIDFQEHTDKTDDRILAEIRTSGFIVADFTGARSGVYFEAGFAMGLGKPVVWTCRRNWIKKLHFDTRQFNHILWDDTTDLREKLRNRINGVIRPLV